MPAANHRMPYTICVRFNLETPVQTDHHLPTIHQLTFIQTHRHPPRAHLPPLRSSVAHCIALSMVLTRRRAAEAAAMAARQKEQQQQQNASPPVQPDPNPTKQPPSKPPQLTLRLAYGTYRPRGARMSRTHLDLTACIAGHVSAFIAIVTTVDAARRLPHTALPVHAFVLLCCTIPLRTVLALAMHSLKQPSVPSGT